MTTEQKINLNMGLTVRNCVTLYESVAKVIPRFMEQYVIMHNAFTDIQSISEKQGTDKTGVAIDKNKIKTKLIALTDRYSRKVTAMAKFMNNDTLLNEVKFSKSALKKLTETTLVEKAQIVYDRVQLHIEDLADQGITAETQKEFSDTITAFNIALKSPRAGIAERKKATEKLSILFGIANGALELMDYAAEAVKDEQADFYIVYRTARKLVDISSGNVALRATALDIISRLPLPGVTFVIRHNGLNSSNSNGSITKKTASKGSFYIRNLASGEYKVNVRKAGYKDLEVNLMIEDGVRNELKIELEKA